MIVQAIDFAITQRYRATLAADSGSAFLRQKIGQQMLDRLDLMKLAPERILHFGAVLPSITSALEKRYPKARVFPLDWSHPQLQKHFAGSFFRKPRNICSAPHHLPLADNSVELIVSNLSLSGVDQLGACYQELARILKPHGLFLFTTFGPDSLLELRQAFAKVDHRHHLHEGIDMHDLGDVLGRCGFAEPVMDMEMLQINYPNISQLFTDLKAQAWQNAHSLRLRGLQPKGRWQAMINAYQEQFVSESGWPVSVEIIYGHAWGVNRP